MRPPCSREFCGVGAFTVQKWGTAAGPLQVVSLALIRNACFRTNEKHFSRAAELESPWRALAGVDAGRYAVPRIVDSGGDAMAAIGLHAGAAAAQSSEEDDGAEYGK